MSTIQSLDALRERIQKMQKSKETIHVSLNNSHPKVSLIDVPAVVKYASAQIFWIERTDHKQLFCNSFQYADLMTGRIQIRELTGE